MRHELHHINNSSSKIIFRDEEDYVKAINRLASCAHATKTEVWAFSIMSTHFHLVVRSPDIRRFTKHYSYNISRGHNHKYLADIHLNVHDRLLTNEFDITMAINYVLKNPVHHGIAETSFSYPYSCTRCYFPNHFSRGEAYCGELVKDRSKSASEIRGRTLRSLFGRQTVPGSFRITDGMMVVPNSFVERSRVEILYKSPRKFLYNMTKPLREELELFDDHSQVSDKALNRVSLFGKKTDIEVCRLIDSCIAPKPYTQITDSERKEIWDSLQKQGVDWHQFLRAT